jgi:hypothetical protein
MLIDMSYLGELENLSDVNHTANLFLPNPFKHKLKKKEKICNGLKLCCSLYCLCVNVYCTSATG